MPTRVTDRLSGHDQGLNALYCRRGTHWRSASNLTAVPFANEAGVPQMGKNDPISGIMAGSPLPQNGVKNFSRKRIDRIRRELGLSGRH